jgi:DNA-binding transcriptional LysR family regulator
MMELKSIPTARTVSRCTVRRIDLTTLRLFVAVCEESCLTRAATREGIAASAVSKRLSDLEEALGVTLFSRLSKGMALTPAGELLRHYARVTLINVEKIAIEVGRYSVGICGNVRILANQSAVVQSLLEDVSGFVGRHSFVKFDLEERACDDVLSGIERGQADIGICDDIATGDLLSSYYRRDRLMVVVRADHSLAALDEVAFVDTLGFDQVSLPERNSICRKLKMEAEQLGRLLPFKFRVPGFDALCRMVQANVGIGIIPERAFEALRGSRSLVAVPLADTWAVSRLKVVTRNTESMPLVARLMFDYLRTVEAVE